jgi:CRISPR-associated protein Cas5t
MASGSTKRVARIRIEAPVTSFRYPHFLIGRQVSFHMPPPSTIYGHAASALGAYPELPFEFGYDFRYRALAQDLEHQQIVTAGGNPFKWQGKKYPKNVEATIQPHLRDFLFQACLTLYLTDTQLAGSFRTPTFCVVLGRSQDLACVTAVEEVTLVENEGAYFEHTLLPFHWRTQLGYGTSVTMPRYIEPPPERHAYFERYIALEEQIWAGQYDGEGLPSPRAFLSRDSAQTYWADPSTPQLRGVHRGVYFHTVKPGN